MFEIGTRRISTYRKIPEKLSLGIVILHSKILDNEDIGNYHKIYKIP